MNRRKLAKMHLNGRESLDDDFPCSMESHTFKHAQPSSTSFPSNNDVDSMKMLPKITRNDARNRIIIADAKDKRDL